MHQSLLDIYKDHRARGSSLTWTQGEADVNKMKSGVMQQVAIVTLYIEEKESLGKVWSTQVVYSSAKTRGEIQMLLKAVNILATISLSG